MGKEKENEIRKIGKGQIMWPRIPLAGVGLYSNCNRKPLEGFKHENDRI